MLSWLKRKPVPSPKATVSLSDGSTYSWHAQGDATSLDCLLLHVAQAARFQDGVQRVTVDWQGQTFAGEAKILSGETLHDALAAMIKADRSLWDLLAIPKTAVGKSKAATIVRITPNAQDVHQVVEPELA